MDTSTAPAQPQKTTKQRRRALRWFSPRWRKVVRDLWENKLRTLLVVLSISVGVFAVGMISGTQNILMGALDRAYAESNPSHATLISLTTFDQNLVDSIANMPEVATAEARGAVFVRLQTGPDEWQLAQLTIIPDFDDIQLDEVRPQSGKWPPEKGEILIERSALGLTQAEVGDTLHLKTPSGKERDVQFVGLAHDMYAMLYVIDGLAYGYITPDTAVWLGEQPGFREVRIQVAENQLDSDHITRVTNLVQDKIEASGSPVLLTLVPPPGQHPLNYVIQAMAIILGSLGFLALLLSGFLVVNTISSLMAQQTRQIGMMKAIGARTQAIAGMYIVTVLVFGVLTLFIALPLGAWGAYQLTAVLADFFNINVQSYAIPPQTLALEIGVALLVPVVASLFPIWSGTRITVREAMNDYGVGSHYGRGWFDQLLVNGGAKLRLSRPMLLSLRNTFRRKKRLFFTLVVLVLSGTIFISVSSLQASLLNTVDQMLDYFAYDVAFQFERPYRIERLIRTAVDHPDVTAVEAWSFYNARLVHDDGTHSGNIVLFAPPPETQLVNPTMQSGRWLTPDDEYAIVVNSILLRDEPGKIVGDTLTFKLGGEEVDFVIVGIATGGQIIGTAFVPHAVFAEETGTTGQADWLMLGTAVHDAATQERVLKDLQTTLDDEGFRVNASSMVAQERSEVQALFSAVILLLFVMTFLLAIVGSFGLTGTMSINVLERQREIGVMRAVGASNTAVRRIFIAEGLLIGFMSWLIALALAWPLSRLMSDAVGQQVMNAPLDYEFSFVSVLGWLVAVMVLATFSSFWPAWNASRLTVQEVLAYE